MLPVNWRPDIFAEWRIQLSSILAVPGFWESITMSWPGERLRAARTRKSWSGVLPTAEDRATKKLRSGMLSSLNADGGMRPALTYWKRRSERVGKIATISRLGWICTTPRKDGSREK